jgi:hypothetical protein
MGAMKHNNPYLRLATMQALNTELNRIKFPN